MAGHIPVIRPRDIAELKRGKIIRINEKTIYVKINNK
jgi:hypothetical protein